MYKLNLIAVVGIVAAVSLVVGMAAAAAAAFAAQHENTTLTTDNNTSSIGNMTGGGNATSMAGNTIDTDDLTGEDVPDDDPDRTVAPTAPDVAADDDTVDNGNGREEGEGEGENEGN